MLTIVLLPGMDGSGDLFQPLIGALDAEFNVRIVRYPTEGALDYEALEKHARLSLPRDGHFVILGESFSGPVAVSLAASRPPGLVGLILCCTFVRNPHPAFTGLHSCVGSLPVKLAPLAVLNWFLLGRYSTQHLRSALAAALAPVSSLALRTRLKAVLSADVTTEFKSIEVPILYLQAEHDRVVPPSATRQVMLAQPATRLVKIAGPHFLLQAFPSQAAQTIAAFMRNTPCR
ncbi:alpha/beta hydrolase [Collimonas sp. H4R21]|uniref:Alpha/beta hydrolase n=1 Tax=Collimonas rhizosphaerae TaxID=3126357 RepID=A0ABU9PYV8_9BURK